MAQADYVVANGTGAAVRSDLNGQLAAIVSNNSGVTEPSTAYAYQWWANTTDGLLYIRNAANNAWITIGTLADANLGLLSRDGGIILNQGGTSFLEIGTGTNTSQSAYIDLVGDTTYTDYGLRLIRNSSGANANSELRHKGTGAFSLITEEAAPIAILTNGVERVEFGTTEVVFNDGGADVDFRIEGDTNADLFKIDAGLDQVQVANLNGGPLAGFRNVIINGNPTINQRGYVSGTATGGANQYTLDRWRVVTSGQNITFTDSANVRTVTAPAGGCEQVVEGASILSGTYTLNWTGTATATVGGTAVAKGGNVTLTGGTDATVKFSSGTFTLVQLEPGPVATPFEQRPIGTELALCQRYYATTRSSVRFYNADGSVRASANHSYFPVTMRTAPSVTMTTTVSERVNVDATYPQASNISVAGFTATIIGTFGTQESYDNNRLWTASAEL
jgi:hypothetical protein